MSNDTDLPNELAPRRRMLMLAIGYGIYVLAGPGILFSGGTPLGAFGLVLWALCASRPGPRKKRIEWIAGAIAFTLQGTWMGIVFWFSLVWLFLGYGCWAVWGGWLMKKLARRMPLALATPLAWIGFESLLAWTPPPIGLSWLRLGHYLADSPVLAGSGRVWGVMGVGFVLAALAGLVADGVRARSLAVGRGSWFFGLAPAALAVLLAVVFSAPETEPGPRLMLVQPAVEQARKQISGDPATLFRESIALTERGLLELETRGEPAPNLVCWGETMMRPMFVADGLVDVIADLTVDPWNPLSELTREQLVPYARRNRAIEREILHAFFGRGGSFQERLSSTERATNNWNGRTRLLAGAEILAAHEGRVRRTNAILLWDDTGRRGFGLKQHLAPGGETMVGLEEVEFVRDIMFNVGGYVPDLLAGTETSVLVLDGEAGESWRMGLSICFDNAFGDVYASPLAAGDLDFHMVASNEAWYEDAQELDQMVAFSRMHALCTGRSFVRCANSGVSCAIGPDGRELARLVVDGSDRQVAGTLTVDVPVPTAAAAATRTPYIGLQPWLLPFGALLPLLVLLLLSRRGSANRARLEAKES